MLAFLLPLLQPLLNFFGGPVIKGLIDAYKVKQAAQGSTERTAEDLAVRELQVQAHEADLNNQYRLAILGRWYEPVNLFAYILVIYFGKVYLWDAAFHMGSTDAVHGAVGEWAGAIVMFLVGKRGVENVTSILTTFLKKR